MSTTPRSRHAIPTFSGTVSSKTVIKCCCGKICKGVHGLKMHQRSCQVIHGLNNELLEDLEEQMHAKKHLKMQQSNFQTVLVTYKPNKISRLKEGNKGNNRDLTL